jgi:hypothetical protein
MGFGYPGRGGFGRGFGFFDIRKLDMAGPGIAQFGRARVGCASLGPESSSF